jgi:hypothetical protein
MKPEPLAWRNHPPMVLVLPLRRGKRHMFARIYVSLVASLSPAKDGDTGKSRPRGLCKRSMRSSNEDTMNRQTANEGSAGLAGSASARWKAPKPARWKVGQLSPP